ncbi:murein biosynthesis protein MurJ, partial [Streptomyces caniscabiei]
PAAIYVAYNVGIITAMFVLGGRWGVRAAALGVAVGGVLMIATQLPALLRQLRRTERGPGSAEAAAREATHRAADAHGTDARGADDRAARPVELT